MKSSHHERKTFILTESTILKKRNQTREREKMVEVSANITIPNPPSKLSELIRLAIKDGREIDRVKNYPRSSVWFEVNDFNNIGTHEEIQEKIKTSEDKEIKICSMCLAGVVIRGTLNIDPNDIKSGEYCHILNRWSPEWRKALNALDQVRSGDYGDAIEDFFNIELDDEEHEEISKALPSSQYGSFQGWEEFDKHINSLEEIANLIERLDY